MTDRFCIDGGGLVVRTESGWFLQVGVEQTQLAAETPPDVVAERFAQLCDSVKGAEKRCVLGMPGNECFFVCDELPDSIDPKDRSAVTFELERHFPLDAESMVADYFVRAASRQIAAVAIETRRHQATVDALQAAGIEVVSILPVAFLIARAFWRSDAEKSPFTLLIFAATSAESLSAESLSVDGGGVYRWRQFHDGDDELRRHQATVADRVDASERTVIVGRSELPFPLRGRVQWCDRAALRLAAEGAGLALGGRWGRWPDLRRGDLAPSDPLFAVAGPLRKLAWAATCCCLILAIAAGYRGNRLAAESETVRRQQRAVFAEAYPGRRVPVMLMRTVRGEHSKTLGSRGRGDAIRLPVPATRVLRDLYRGLEHAQRVGGVRLRLMDLKIVDGVCSVTVRAVDAVQIGTIAKSLETIGFDVTPPAAEQIDPSKDEPIPTYQSTLSAVWNAPANRVEEGVDS
ncbi:hypothetical protein Enr13x_01220 [Stieleria neptunia]|uniref:GspL periplasmic domain protein n=1 Tax=Stieleria neptunia TaxID=2527979 RepID=A0A518HHJ7_9BACT|nr:hypothetical protein [Stieleria neptunia]QDV40316.1 hypothetical protein Enr13x_01220 [Stieleria neptunia]